MTDTLESAPVTDARPPQPAPHETITYLGWECGYDELAAFWSGAGWRAYFGGCDLGAPSLEGETWKDLCRQIEDEHHG